MKILLQIFCIFEAPTEEECLRKRLRGQDEELMRPRCMLGAADGPEWVSRERRKKICFYIHPPGEEPTAAE